MVADANAAQGALWMELGARVSVEVVVASMCHALGIGSEVPEPGSPVERSRVRIFVAYERVRTLVVDAFRHGVWQTLTVARARYPRIDLASLSMGYDAALGDERATTDELAVVPSAALAARYEAAVALPSMDT